MGDAMLEAAHDHHMIGDHATLQQAHAPVRERSIQHSVQTSPDVYPVLQELPVRLWQNEARAVLDLLPLLRPQQRPGAREPLPELRA